MPNTLRDDTVANTQPLTLTIERIGAGPDGVARLPDGKTVFVPMTAPGDTITAMITEQQPRFARASVLTVDTPGPDRVDPSCPYYGECGGCDYQHVSRTAELAMKRDIVASALARIGKLPEIADAVGPTVHAARDMGYRNKIELNCVVQNGRLSVGYMRRGSATLIEVEQCPLLDTKKKRMVRSVAGALRHALGDATSDLERLAIRSSSRTGATEIALTTATGQFPRAQVSRVLADSLDRGTGVVRVMMKDTAKSRKVAGVEVLSGKGFWRERIGAYEYAVSAPSFFQVNTEVAEMMVGHVLEQLSPTADDAVLDLYAGVGTFTLPLAATGAEVVAIESYGPAVRDLRRNIEMNRLDADVIGGDVAREIDELDGANLAVVDPPRAGLERTVIDALCNSEIERLAYVSCDPATLARDLAVFASSGFAVESVTPFDMFPQTYHVETVAMLSRKVGSCPHPTSPPR